MTTRRRSVRRQLSTHLAVAAGAAIGGVLRAGASIASVGLLGPGFPWGTLAVNAIGSFVIGAYATLTGPDGRVLASSRQRQFVMAGFCGGFTTFSVFGLETFRFAAEGRHLLAAANVAGSVATWFLAVWAGYSLAMWLNRLGGARRTGRRK